MKRQAARNRGLVMLGVGTVLTAVLLLIVLNAGASPPAPLAALSCASSGAPCVLTAGAAGTSVSVQNADGKSTATLSATLVQSPANAGFVITSDSCSGTALGPSKTCSVTVAYTKVAPTTNQTATLTVSTKKAPIQSASAYFTVHQGNHAPIAVADSYSGDQGILLTVSALDGVLANDMDADGDPLTAVRVSGPTAGTLTLNQDGSFSYVRDSPGPASFTYEATDTHGASSNVVTVTIDVAPCCATATPTPPGTPTPDPAPATPTPGPN